MAPEPDVRLAGFNADSRVNGPGRRVVVWVQGCTLGCRGCFNPGTHAVAGEVTPVSSLLDRMLAARRPEVTGVTFSGGEPFQQAVALSVLAARLRTAWPEASLWAFTGYTHEALRGRGAPPGAAALLDVLDVLVDGPFVAALPTLRPWRASANQRLWVLGRGTVFETPAPGRVAEIQVEPDGAVLLSGFPDAGLLRTIRELAR